MALTDVLAVVRSSPEAVAAHDKQRWMSLFAESYVIEDPVGSRPVRGEAISDFWDCFIEHNDIAFEVHHDWVDGLQVVRDVTIHTTLATGITVHTPAHLRYTLDEDLKITHMAAHWEPAPVFAQLMRPNPKHVRSMVTMNARMFDKLGLGGTARFVGAVRSVGRMGKDAVAVQLGDKVEDIHKVIAAGDTVSLTCTVEGGPAAVIATLDRSTRTFRDCRMYTQLADRVTD
ncbi:MAG TPA: nuclear transport factor 2 family protein [Nocardioidaceae bacterium]|nr:nuclear transport factor 2 family protein [Nocardioidaceae bacterium]